MENDKYITSSLSKGFINELLRLAYIAADAEGDTLNFTLGESNGIRMDVSISFSYTRKDEEAEDGKDSTSDI